MKIVKKSTDYLKEKLQKWRQEFHQNPECDFEEHKTSEKIYQILNEAGISCHRHIGMTGLVAEIKKGTSDRSIALRAELDALYIQEENDLSYQSTIEGKMHACGHDGHIVMLIGAALYLARQGEFDGTVYLIFQPAEETGKGALAMMEDELFTRFSIDAIYGMHNLPTLEPGKFALCSGPIMACEDLFTIEIEGKGCHAAMPHLGIDPLPIAAEIILALQTISSRNVDPIKNVVVSATEIYGTGKRNVIGSKVTIKGDARSFLPEIQDLIEQRMKQITEGICSAHGASSHFEYQRMFVSTINSQDETAIATKVAKELVGEENVMQNCQPIMASEDFGRFLREKPGCFLFIGNGGEPLHNSKYDFQDDILTLGSDFWVRLVEEVLC